ncbi:esterase-like activity of phytase family protein [Agrobacterium sp. BT-220-3]|nr:esterase-like activity of phytase family protein [Agrobacterium sp. BT-220-3]
MFRIITIATFCFAALPAAAQTPPAPSFLGQIVVPSGLSINGVTFGGISDLTFDSETGRYLAISDDRVEKGPARYYELELAVTEGVVTLNIAATRELKDETGAAFAPQGIDAEGIALDRKGGKLYWSSERDLKNQPAIYVSDLDGGNVKRLELPDAYLVNDAKTKGVQNNLGFEGLSLASGKLIAATENALTQDGQKATPQAGSPARILVIDTATLKPVAEHVYVTEAISKTPTAAEPKYNDNGLSALAALPDGRFVAVERNFASGVGNHIRFFIVDLSGAENILGKDKIDAANMRPVSKTPWFEINEGDFGLDVDNIESLAFGPVVDGKQLFVIASDDNFNPGKQFTQFAAFAIPANLGQ